MLLVLRACTLVTWQCSLVVHAMPCPYILPQKQHAISLSALHLTLTFTSPQFFVMVENLILAPDDEVSMEHPVSGPCF